MKNPTRRIGCRPARLHSRDELDAGGPWSPTTRPAPILRTELLLGAARAPKWHQFANPRRQKAEGNGCATGGHGR
jgi:hypothetical protein